MLRSLKLHILVLELGLLDVANKQVIKGIGVSKKPQHTSTIDRRGRSLKHEYVNDNLADIRERFYDKVHKKSVAPSLPKKSKRDEKLAVTGVEESQKRRMTTNGLNANEARKALATELKGRMKK
jgi:hypothetical protein